MGNADTYFKGKNVVITGGSSGIGKATAELLARQGANVFIIARDRTKLERALQEIEVERHNPQQRFGAFSADVTSSETVEATLAAIVEAEGSPDVLINSAGIVQPGYVEALPLSSFRDQMDVNYFGTLYAVRAVLPYMMERRHGHIVNISSVAGAIGLFGYTGYGASKFAVRGFSEALRVELRPYDIGVSVVIPSDTDTPQLRGERKVQPVETRFVEGQLKPHKMRRPAEFMAYWLVRLVNSGGEPASAEEVAASVLRGIQRGRFLIVPDPVFGLAYYFRGLVIPLANWAFDKLVPLAREQRGAH